MIVWLTTAWARPPIVLDVPFPTARLFDTPDRVCLLMSMDAPDSDSTTEMSDFSVQCAISSGQLSACVTLHSRTWPSQVPPLLCGPEDHAIRMRPVPAFDPAEDIWDGVSLVRDVAVLQAAYRVEHPDAAGLMMGGRCGLENGRFWFKTKNQAKRQTCTLVVGETEHEIPIRLVRRLPKKK